MAARKVHVCECPECGRGIDGDARQQHERMNLLMSTLNHQQRRWYAAVEAERLGHGGLGAVSGITGVREARAITL